MLAAKAWTVWLLALFAAAPIVARAESDPATEARRLFELGASPSARALLAAKNHYQKLPPTVRNQTLLQYAYALVLIRQKRLPEAEALLKQTAEARPRDLAVWQARVWTILTLGERAKALEELKRFNRRLLSDAASASDETAVRETAAFLGQVSGFLSGPWRSRLHADELDKLRGQLRGSFEAGEQDAFDQAEQDVLAAYDRLHQRHDSLAHQALTKDREQLQQSRSELKQEETSLQDAQDSLDDKEFKRSNEAKAKLAELDARLQSLQQRAESILKQIVPLELQREALTAQLMPVNPAAPPGSPAARFTGQKIAYDLQIQRLLAPIVSRLFTLQGQLAQVQDTILEVQKERAELVAHRAQDSTKSGVKKQELDRQQVRLDRKSKRLQVSPTSNTVQVRSDAMRLSLLSTYVEFPFEQEKQRVLSLLDADANRGEPAPAGIDKSSSKKK